MHRAKGLIKTNFERRNDMIDFLLANNEGGSFIDDKWIPVYDLDNQQLALLCVIVGDENGSRVDEQYQEGTLPAGRIGRGCHPQNKRNGREISQTRAKICLIGI
jgi:hypothetical protein